MVTKRMGGVRSSIAAALAMAAMMSVPVLAHHSFSIFNMEQTKVYTGVVTRVNPDTNHLQIYFAPMNAERKNVERGTDGKPVVWAVEMAGAAQSATLGISVNSFPPGTIFSVALHPLRSGESAGSRDGAVGLFKCPPKTPPAPGKHCDSVAGSEALGEAKHPLPAN